MIESLFLTVLYGIVNYVILKKIVLITYFNIKNYLLLSLCFLVLLLLIKFFYPADIRGYTFGKKKLVILTFISYGIIFFNALKYFFDEKFVERIKKMNFRNIDETEESDSRRWEALTAFCFISFLQLFVIWIPKILR